MFHVRALHRVGGGCYLDERSEMRVENDRAARQRAERENSGPWKNIPSLHSLTIISDESTKLDQAHLVARRICLPVICWFPRFTVLIVVHVVRIERIFNTSPVYHPLPLYVESFTRMNESSPALLINYSELPAHVDIFLRNGHWFDLSHFYALREVAL
jgi:hypothetical protein